MDANRDALDRLKEAFDRRELTLFVGAGASVESGLPSWKGFLAGVFINSLRGIRASNMTLMQATAETWFQQVDAPPDVVARQMRTAFSDPEEFIRWVRFALYKWIPFRPSGRPTQEFIASLVGNKTLGAIAGLCRRTRFGTNGLKRVITYNFDDLLELILGNDMPHESVWGQADQRPSRLPIHHVHGFLPVRSPWSPYPRGAASGPDQIVLTEDQYHREASQPYGYSNLMQLQSLSDSIGLTVGLSMSDPNMRRILDISANSATTPEVYALLPRQAGTPMSEQCLADAFDRADELRRRGHPWAGVDAATPLRRTQAEAAQGRRVWKQLDDLAMKRHVKVMRELGVRPIWCEHDEIAGILSGIAN